MSGVKFDISVVTNSSDAAINGIISGFNTATGAANGFTSSLNKIGDAAFRLNNIKAAISGIASDFNNAIQPGIDFNYQLKETQAIAGVTDDQMKTIGASARQLAKDFGIDATKAAESYKFILSQLGPELANTPKALEGMGRASAILSKQLGGDTAKATEILATAMNQYGVSLKDPMKATETMGVMMNIMSAAAQEGSAEMPNIKSAIEASGMMAKTANVSFTELNAAIQVLDKAGKRGAEGGVAVRNVLADLAELPAARGRRVIRAMLEEAGISINALSDKSKTFSERLQLLKPIVSNTAAMTLLWGKENVAAGIALIQGTSEIDRFTAKIKGTNSAQEMATTIMGAWSEKMARVNAKMKDLGISIFNATSGFVPFIQIGMGALSIMANLALASTLFGKIGLMSAIRSLGTMVVSMGSWIATTTMATLAQLGLNAAMYANPIGVVVLVISAAIAAIIALVKYWDVIWNAIAGFGKWIWEHNPFKWLIDVVDRIFPGFKNAMNSLFTWIEQKFDALLGWFKKAWGWIKGLFGAGKDETSSATKAAIDDYTKSINQAEIKGITTPFVNPGNTKDPLKKDFVLPGRGGHGERGLTTMASNITGGGPRNVTINIQKLQDQIVVHTTNLSMGAKQAADEIVEQILRVLNSINGKVANE